MAVTAIFNGLKGLSRFWLWRVDAAREKIEAEVRQVAGHVVSHGPTRHFSTNELLIDQKARRGSRYLEPPCDVTGSLRAPGQVLRHADGRRNILSIPAIDDGRYDRGFGKAARQALVFVASCLGARPVSERPHIFESVSRRLGRFGADGTVAVLRPV